MRNSDYNEIVSALQFNSEIVPPRRYLDYSHHDFCWFFGDLNYRLDAPVAKILVELERKEFKSLLTSDQLSRQMALNNAFRGFFEPAINFPPTYKYNTGEFGDVYDLVKGTKSKPPAYCDRCLYLPSAGLSCREYVAIQSASASDHKPIRAIFNAQVRFVVVEKLAAVKDEVLNRLHGWHKGVTRTLCPSVIENFMPMEDNALLQLKTGISSFSASLSRATNAFSNGVIHMSADKEYIDEHTISGRERDKSVSGGLKKFVYF